MSQVQFFDPMQEKESKRRRKYAEVLLKNSQQPQGTEVVSGYAVKQSPLQGLARAIQGGMAGYQEGKADELESASEKRRQEMLAKAVSMMGTDPQGAYGMLMQDPSTSEAGLKLSTEDMKSQREASKPTEAQRNWNWIQNLPPDQRKGAAGAIFPKAGEMTVDPDTGEVTFNTPSKPLPAAALKLQDEATDALANASNIVADLGGYKDQLEKGDLNLGLFENVKSRIRNFLGASTPESSNYSSFRSGLEKLRNDSLRLNKGVQTEGDAQRAWNELVANINDEDFVKDRLQEIQKINERAIKLQKTRIGNIRKNYGADELDTSVIENPEGIQTPTVSSKKIRNRKTGEIRELVNGKWVTVK